MPKPEAAEFGLSRRFCLLVCSVFRLLSPVFALALALALVLPLALALAIALALALDIDLALGHGRGVGHGLCGGIAIAQRLAGGAVRE